MQGHESLQPSDYHEKSNKKKPVFEVPRARRLKPNEVPTVNQVYDLIADKTIPSDTAMLQEYLYDYLPAVESKTQKKMLKKLYNIARSEVSMSAKEMLGMISDIDHKQQRFTSGSTSGGDLERIKKPELHIEPEAGNWDKMMAYIYSFELSREEMSKLSDRLHYRRLYKLDGQKQKEVINQTIEKILAETKPINTKTETEEAA